ncbi:Hydroxyethylthiazole kinase [bioreactor metagenome]|uniref:hydroxyethylthiazole kinase n=1 Tax=bioreactor metagenome TaxID=1076179 RepID=A0A645DXN2_9ZZZZ
MIRGNISEIKTLALGAGTTKGVDADVADTVNDSTLDSTIDFAKKFSEKMGAVIAITGAIDIVADSKSAYIIRNGHPILSKITGSGCMLTAMIAAYMTANDDNMLEATAAAVCAMGFCGEKAFNRMSAKDGNASFRNYLIDEIFNLDGDKLEAGAKYDIR